jgi:hypothetical protein
MINSCGILLERCLRNFKIPAIDIRLDGRVIKHTHCHLGVRGLAAQLIVGVTKRLAHGVHAHKSSCGEKVLALQASSAHGVLLGPHRVGILREELSRGQLITSIAARRSSAGAKVSGAAYILEIRKALLVSKG